VLHIIADDIGWHLCMLVGVVNVERLIGNKENIHVIIRRCPVRHRHALGKPDEAHGAEVSI
jgi:hypothetical protein